MARVGGQLIVSGDDKENSLVIMPFGKTPEEKLLYNLTYEHIILPAMKLGGWEASRVDREFAGDEPLSQYIEERLRTAPLVVADISGNNPNVMFELGARRVHGKPFVCVSSNPSAADFFARQFQIHDYNEPDAMEKVAAALRKVLADACARESSELQLDELTRTIRGRSGFKNPFHDRLCSWRMRRACAEVHAIHGGAWHFGTLTPSQYVAYIFQSIVSELREGEEYWTVTNVSFWAHQFVGESELLAANIDAALRGVTIRRVFLIDRQEWNTSTRETALGVLRKHLLATQKIRANAPDGMQVKCLLAETFSEAVEHYGHFALALHDKDGKGPDGSLIVTPEPPVQGIIRRVKIDLTNGGKDRPKHRHIGLFQHAFSDATDIEQFMHSAEQNAA